MPLLVRAFGYVLITPFIEEFAFRGYLLRRLAWLPLTGQAAVAVGWFPLVVSSGLFGATHSNVALGFVAGVIFALAARRWGLGGAVAAHIATNGVLALSAIVSADAGAMG